MPWPVICEEGAAEEVEDGARAEDVDVGVAASCLASLVAAAALVDVVAEESPSSQSTPSSAALEEVGEADEDVVEGAEEESEEDELPVSDSD